MTDEERVESIIQIASSFGISCDDASYIVKSFENFGKEYMMSNIEDDLKAKGFIEGYKQIKNNASIIKSIDKDFFFELVDFLLEDREQDKARIKELEEENKALELQNKQLEYYIEELKKYNKTVSDRIIEYKKNSIPKQKVKDKIEELENAKRETTRENWHYIYSIQLKILQELLEEGE